MTARAAFELGAAGMNQCRTASSPMRRDVGPFADSARWLGGRNTIAPLAPLDRQDQRTASAVKAATRAEGRHGEGCC
jgi:hypothetical protein